MGKYIVSDDELAILNARPRKYKYKRKRSLGGPVKTSESPSTGVVNGTVSKRIHSSIRGR